MKLNEVQKITGLARRTIHFYVKEGLISPEVDESNGYFDFSDEDVQRLLLVREFRKADISLSVIRSLLDNPRTAVYYLRTHAEQVRKKIRYLEQTLGSLKYVSDELPLNSEFSSLFGVVMNAGFPDMPAEGDTRQELELDVRMINQFMWACFLPAEKFSDYQEFLWAKLEAIAASDKTGDYRKISEYLHTLSREDIDAYYLNMVEYGEHFASMTSAVQQKSYSEKQILALREFVRDKKSVSDWNSKYESFHLPRLKVGTDELNSRLMTELSPLFRAYLENLKSINALTYSWLMSDDGRALYNEMKEKLGENLDLEIGSHAQIEYIVSLAN